MSDPDPEILRFVESSGGIAVAVERATELHRKFWTAAMAAPDDAARADRSRWRFVSRAAVAADVVPLVDALVRAGLARPVAEEGWRIALACLETRSFIQQSFGGLRHECDLDYFVRRAIRRGHDAAWSAVTASRLHALARHAEAFLEESGSSKNVSYALLRRELLERSAAGTPDAPVDLFLEACLLVGYLRASVEPGSVYFLSSKIDAEYLLSNLFGLPTRIPGFDALFGGGGVIIPDGVGRSTDSYALSGRTILIRGRYATGKSILALQMAFEVACKGGLAWYIPIEQTADEVLYTLASIADARDLNFIHVCTDAYEAMEILRGVRRLDGGRGALIILREAGKTYDAFFESFTERAAAAAAASAYDLRVLVCDPINSLVPALDEAADLEALRARTVAALHENKISRTTSILVAEDSTAGEDSLRFEENVADVVLELKIDPQRNYSQRYFTIQKSRLQREQRGGHPFSVVPGKGICILHSSAAVSARIRNRTGRTGGIEAPFGLDGMDKIMGRKSIRPDDAIVFRGAPTECKNDLAVAFLAAGVHGPTGPAEDPFRKSRRSLLVVVGGDEKASRARIRGVRDRTPQVAAAGGRNLDVGIRVLALPCGFVSPGFIYSELESAIESAGRENVHISRVAIEGIELWDSSCPFIAQDPAFGATLATLLRRQGIAALYLCGGEGGGGAGVVQRPFEELADWIFTFSRVEFRGSADVHVRLDGGRRVTEPTRSFEVHSDRDGVRVVEGAELLRVSGDGAVSSILVRLFLYSDSRMHQAYNRRVARALGSVLSADVKVSPRGQFVVNYDLKLAHASAIDELQIVALDEYEVFARSPAMTGLHRFDDPSAERRAETLEALQRPKEDSSQEFRVVPYYCNVSLLAWRESGIVEPQAVTSWEALEQECVSWEKGRPREEVFFDFSRAHPENLNCLYFEILLSLIGPKQHEGCPFRSWLATKEARRAGRILYRLSRRSYLRSIESSFSDVERRRWGSVATDAVVWRHWYSTLNTMLAQMAPAEREGIRVGSLPGGVSIAGHWYLGVPVHSSAPNVGLDVVRTLTAADAEIERFRLGLGLPTRKEFYEGAADSDLRSWVSPHIAMPMSELTSTIERAFRRSRYACYSKASDILGFHLQRLLEIPDMPTRRLEARVADILSSVRSRLPAVIGEGGCASCRASSRPGTRKSPRSKPGRA
jgi:KaiC/GvpD/RAD55 family RecA-like ATPase